MHSQHSQTALNLLRAIRTLLLLTFATTYSAILPASAQSTSEYTKVHARHILVQSENEAIRIVAQINDGADFEELAKQYSIGPSASQGGDIGWFERGKMVKTFEDSAFALKVGNTSQPVKTVFGWHVIQLLDVEVAMDQDAKPTAEQAGKARINVLASIENDAEFRKRLLHVANSQKVAKIYQDAARGGATQRMTWKKYADIGTSNFLKEFEGVKFPVSLGERLSLSAVFVNFDKVADHYFAYLYDINLPHSEEIVNEMIVSFLSEFQKICDKPDIRWKIVLGLQFRYQVTFSDSKTELLNFGENQCDATMN